MNNAYIQAVEDMKIAGEFDTIVDIEEETLRPISMKEEILAEFDEFPI